MCANKQLSKTMQRLIVPFALVGTCLAETTQSSDDLVLDLQDPWTIAAIAILSILGLLLVVRMCMGMVSVSVETQVTGPDEVVVELTPPEPQPQARVAAATSTRRR